MQRSRGNNYKGQSARGSARRRPYQPGMFKNNIWHCDCTPPLPALHLQVKKENQNKGRWFWTCQHPEAERCAFFLWQDDAERREMALVLGGDGDGNSGPESSKVAHQDDFGATPKDKSSATIGSSSTSASPSNQETPKGKGLFASMATPVTMGKSLSDATTSDKQPTIARTSAKRTAFDARLDEDDDFALDDSDEVALAAAAHSPLMQTPNKAAKTGVYATPGTTGERSRVRKLPWVKESAPISSFFTSTSFTADDCPTTPATRKSVSLTDDFPTTPTTTTTPARKSVSFTTDLDDLPVTPTKSTNIPLDFQSPSLSSPTTPTHQTPTLPSSPSPVSRYRDAFSDPADSEATLAKEVLSLLSSFPETQNLSTEKLSRLRGILSRHDLRTVGVTRGRDAVRVALRAKEARIAELQARVAELEADRETDRLVIRKLRSSKVQGRGQVAGFGA